MTSYRSEREHDFYSGSHRTDNYGNRSSRHNDHYQKKRRNKTKKRNDMPREQKVDILFNYLQAKGGTQYDKIQLETFFAEMTLHKYNLDTPYREALAAYNLENKDSRNVDAILNAPISYVPKETKGNVQGENYHQKNNYQYGDCNADIQSLPLRGYGIQSQNFMTPSYPTMQHPVMLHYSSGIPPPVSHQFSGGPQPSSQPISHTDLSTPPTNIPQLSTLFPGPNENLHPQSSRSGYPQSPSNHSGRAGYSTTRLSHEGDSQNTSNKDHNKYASPRVPSRHQILRNEIPNSHGFSSKETSEGDSNQRQIVITRKEDLDPWNFFPDRYSSVKKEFPMDAIRMTDDEIWFERHICSLLNQERDFFGPYHLQLYEQTLNAKCNRCISGLGDIHLIDHRG